MPETPTPTHLLPDSCHVCGWPKSDHEPGSVWAGMTGHVFWSNADALAEAREHDRQVLAAGGPVYSSGARSAEEHYVLTERPG